VSIDIFEIDSGQYKYGILGVDNFSRFCYIEKLDNTNSITIFNALLRMFKNTHFPRFILSDNAKVLRSHYFKSKIGEYGALLRCSAPYLSNGNLAENYIRIFKHHCEKEKGPWHSDEILYKILLKINCMEPKPSKIPPYAIQFRRYPELQRLCSLEKPMEEKIVERPTWTAIELSNLLARPQNLNSDFQVGSRIFWRPKGNKSPEWRQGNIKKIEHPLFVITDDNGKTYTRHAKHTILKAFYQ